MIADLPARRPVFDSVRAPHRLTLGLRALHADESWIDVDADLAADLLEKERLLESRRDEVLVEVPASRDAQREALDRIVGELVTRHPGHYTQVGDVLRLEATGGEIDLRNSGFPPLERAARCVQEDWVVMQSRPDGWCLTAAVVCFPTRWALRPQLGRPMAQIHQRVPGYRQKLDASSNRFFDGMKAGHVFARGNWSLMDDPSLFQPTGKMHDQASRARSLDEAADEVWLRVEHQTLQRLPRTGAILFGIRIHRTRLRELAQRPDVARDLAEAIETMSPEMQRYKSLAVVRDATLDFLRRVTR